MNDWMCTRRVSNLLHGSFEHADRLKRLFRYSRDELIRASQSIPRNIAEGNGKRSLPDRKRFFEIARGSALECAAVLDQLQIMTAFNEAETKEGKQILHRIVSMLTKMTKPVDGVRNNLPQYGFSATKCSNGQEPDYEYAHEHEE